MNANGKEANVRLYTDGSCIPNPGSGGWAALLITLDGKHERLISGIEAESTNNRAELLAVIEGLKVLKQPTTVSLYSDSQWVIQCITRAYPRTANPDLWRVFEDAAAPHHIVAHKVKGHAGDEFNERVHKAALKAARGFVEDVRR